METCSVVLTFESVDEILLCEHSNKTSSAELLHGTICVLIFYKMKFLALSGVKGLKNDGQNTYLDHPNAGNKATSNACDQT